MPVRFPYQGSDKFYRDGRSVLMKRTFDFLGRVWALAFTYSILLTLLVVLAEDAHIPAI
jgi:hypothetical protein